MRKTFEVFYEDGNRKLFEAPSIELLCRYLAKTNQFAEVYKIAERVNGKTR